MKLIHSAMLTAHAAALASLMEVPPNVPRRVIVKDDNPGPPPEKVSRQRKRWLERQARKQTRKHRTTRR